MNFHATPTIEYIVTVQKTHILRTIKTKFAHLRVQNISNILLYMRLCPRTHLTFKWKRFNPKGNIKTGEKPSKHWTIYVVRGIQIKKTPMARTILSKFQLDSDHLFAFSFHVSEYR